MSSKSDQDWIVWLHHGTPQCFKKAHSKLIAQPHVPISEWVHCDQHTFRHELEAQYPTTCCEEYQRDFRERSWFKINPLPPNDDWRNSADSTKRLNFRELLALVKMGNAALYGTLLFAAPMIFFASECLEIHFVFLMIASFSKYRLCPIAI